jgi:hypothetical protein
LERGEVDVPLEQAWTTTPDNAWDHRFEEVHEYPETENEYLTLDGKPSLLSRAWHQLLIGLNSDASGWFPWTPRTRHRNLALQTSRSLSNEILTHFASKIAAKLKKPKAKANAYVLALNPAPSRTAEVSLETEVPMAFVEAKGKLIPTATSLADGRWSARARVQLPAYGYKLLGLVPSREVERSQWSSGSKVRFAGAGASLSNAVLTIAEGKNQVEVSVAPFRLSDPSGAAKTEDVTPNWHKADTRIRQTMFGNDLEVFTELAWAIWLRLVISLREDRIEIAAEVHVDMPRRIGNLKYDPAGLLLQFKGQPGAVYYDIPYAVIRHKNDEPSFVAAQRFVAMESEKSSFGLIALGGNQSFKVSGKDGIIAANLGASTQGRPDTRPECILRPDGTGEHKITSGGDPFMGSYYHRFALVFADLTHMALTARDLRTAVPLARIQPGRGKWPSSAKATEGKPAEQSLLTIKPSTVHATAFRVTPTRCEIVLNDVSGKPQKVSCNRKSASLVPYGVVAMRFDLEK